MKDSLYVAVCERIVAPLGDMLSGQSVLKYFRYYRDSAYWPHDRLREEQDRLLRQTVRVAYEEVPFYRRLFDAHGILPNDIRSIADLSRLPAVSKQMLKDCPSRERERASGKPNHVYSTSGSTGHPFSLRVDSDTMSRARALMLLRTTFAGYRMGERVLQTGTAPERGILKSVKDKALRVIYVSAFDLSDTVVDRYLDLMNELRIDHLTGYAQSLHVFAARARRRGFNRRLKSAVSWGALLLPHYRDDVRAAFGCRIYDSYGVGEGMQIAAQCGVDDNTYHQFCLHVACEVVRDGTPAQPGETGELLLTRLDPGVTPLLRYRIGDLGALPEAGDCACGRQLPVMTSIVGRTSDIIRTPSGRTLIIHFFSRIFSSAPLVRQFQIVQRQADSIHVRLVVDDEFTADDWTRLKDELLRLGDPDWQVTMEVVPEIAVGPNAKRRYIVSELPGSGL